MKVKSIILSTLLISPLPFSGWAASPFGDFASKQTLHYDGVWKNTTFSSTDTYEVTLEIDGRNFSMTTTIEGNVYGIGISVPLVFNGSLEEDDLTTLSSNFATYGDVSATINSSSSPFVMSATSTPGASTGIAPSTAEATFDFESMAATFVVNFSGGGSAVGTSEMSLVEQAPAILSISPSQSVVSGASANLSVETSGSLVSVQWYSGESGETSMPVQGATDQIFNTGALTQAQDFWVRVENSAGASVDSPTVSITVSDPWYSAALELGDGWRWFGWFKEFRPVAGFWLYHARHGWLFTQAEASSSMFIWDAGLARWMWTSETLYPWLYAFGPDETWVYFFEDGSPGARFFARGDTQAIVSEQALRVNP